MQPKFLITIDAEGDNLWARRPGPPTTENARFLPRFQQVCESYGFRPVYLVDYTMAQDAFMIEFGRDVVRRNAGEIGAHPHPWEIPPFAPLTDSDGHYHPFMIEYPADVMRAKLKCLTDLLENTFQVGIVSHRAGRWAFNAAYARVLEDIGYRVDCSVTPYVSWASNKGCPDGPGGSDYTRFPSEAYFPDASDLSRRGGLRLLEIPVTIAPRRGACLRRCMPHAVSGNIYAQHLLRRLCPLVWLRPDGHNLKDMLWLTRRTVEQRRDYVEFMLHSSELMPGGSPVFENEASIEKLYADLESLFDMVSTAYTGSTLAEYADLKNRENHVDS